MTIPRVINVIANDDYTLTLTFNNYEIRMFDMLPYISEKHPIFKELIDLKLFNTVVPWEGTIQWCHGQDLCPDTLYSHSGALPNQLPRIITIIPNEDFTLTLTFSNSEIKTFDMNPYINKELLQFHELSNLTLFKSCSLWYGMVQWDIDQEQIIRPDTCYMDSVSISNNKKQFS